MPAIEILASSIFSQSFIVFVVAGILFTMFFRVRDSHLLLWSFSWLSYSLFLAIGGIGFLARVGNWSINQFELGITICALFFGYNSILFLYLGTKKLLNDDEITLKQIFIYQVTISFFLTCIALIISNYPNDQLFYFLTFATRALIAGLIFFIAGVQIFIHKRKYKGAKIFSFCLMIYALVIQTYSLQGILGLLGNDLPGFIIGVLGIVDFTIQTIVVFSLVSWVLQKEHQQVINTQKRLQELAWEDSLTGLPNRLWLNEKSMPILKSLQNCRHAAALLFIDLDGFKKVNDTHGHATGDKLLKIVAQILKENLKENDMACRLGGDEFILLLIDQNDRDKVIAVADTIREQLEAIKIMDGHKIEISCSQGIAWFPDHAMDLETLIQLSDHAMYQAKEQGKAQLVEVSYAQFK